MKINYQMPTVEVLKMTAADVLTNSPVWEYTDPENDNDDVYQDNF